MYDDWKILSNDNMTSRKMYTHFWWRVVPD